MFLYTFSAELNTRVGSNVEVATDSNLIEGILSNVTSQLVLVIDVSNGYGTEKIYISLNAINFVRFT
ncbi:hypothetical protein GT022_11300 [Agaribacter marinus]|uniref:DUF2642 domain-containing protein n=1 Tax=Virgibacillus salarius TaxID=447199 RepID=A0A941DT10_9BACI|nr:MULTISPECIES: hypothetical protein [Bacillaceae]MBR7796629.1 hypothetical protein [Virgibacillus salarius]NAZ09338.1 hypothetical protein [Agaribacter marinus]WBX80856.1 hypothetical protein PD280_03330 [Virgibacillus salarius]